MKKLLSLLNISTMASSIPAPLPANETLKRVKRNISTLTTSNSNNDYFYLPPTKINMSYFGDVDDVSSIYDW